MYASINDVQDLLPPSVTLGDSNIGSATPVPGAPASNRNALSPSDVIQYVRWAQQEIDARLRNIYACPLRRIKQFETALENDLTAGANVTVTVEDTSVFSIGDIVRIQDRAGMETTTITSITDFQNMVVTSLSNAYDADNGKISIIKFPDPIPLITARLAVAIAFDKLFTAEQAPDVSQYGQEQRKQAANGIDSILSGTVLLFGQEITGRRFVRGSLFDAYDSPVKDFQFGREKS